MLKMSYETLLFIMAIELVIILLVQWLYTECKSNDYIECNYTVISKKTGNEYDCIAIRENEEYILEIKIYNYFTCKYEWHPYYNFIFLSK